jgi:hypothetical protein
MFRNAFGVRSIAQYPALVAGSQISSNVLRIPVIALDLVDHRETFKKLWAMLLRGYAFDASLDAGAAAQPLTKEAVESWLRTTVAGAHLAPHDLTGEGEYLSVTGDRVTGGVTVHEGHVVHAALFPSTAP